MKDILIAARAKIADQANWTQHALARDADNNNKPDSHPQANNVFWSGLTGRDPLACKFCALGAVEAVEADDSRFRQARDALNTAAFDLFRKLSIFDVNDNIGHVAVLQCYDHAIEAAVLQCYDHAINKENL
jgi:hypothetical protein